MENKVRELIADADLVLIGIGKEFEKSVFCQEEDALNALNRLANILEKKNYYAVSLCTNDIAKKSDLVSDRVVQPCGTVMQKQCPNRCEEGLQNLSAVEYAQVMQFAKENGLEENPAEFFAGLAKIDLGMCPKCNSILELNTVYTQSYDENGYLKDWARYTKWLQGTLNKKLCILELGVDLTYPSIIRWPFEKIAFYNNKAHFVRVNERLFHMSEELKDKGISVPKNAVEWLLED